MGQAIPNLQKSLNDKKSYRYVVLANGLRALLISDPEISGSALDGAASTEDDCNSISDQSGRNSSESGTEVRNSSLASSTRPVTARDSSEI